MNKFGFYNPQVSACLTFQKTHIHVYKLRVFWLGQQQTAIVCEPDTLFVIFYDFSKIHKVASVAAVKGAAQAFLKICHGSVYFKGFAVSVDEHLSQIAFHVCNLAGVELQMDTDRLTSLIKEEFGQETMMEYAEDELISLIIQAYGVQIICTLMPFPVPEREVENLIPYNMLPSGCETDFKEHQAFIVVAGRGFDISEKRKACFLFNRLCGVIMGMEQAAGMYMGGAGLPVSAAVYGCY